MTGEELDNSEFETGFFGRRKGRPLRKEQSARFEDLLPRLMVPVNDPAPDDLTSLFSVPVKCVRLEIGFGGGEHLIHRALENPDIGYIGCEPFINGMAKALMRIHELGLKNIRLYDRDALEVLDWLPDASLDRVVLLYPDPWPKRRHWKRRFVGEVSLPRLARVLKTGGQFHFASDIDTYVDWTLFHVRRRPEFRWLAKDKTDWSQPWHNWISTRYEQKALREGRIGCYLTFERT